MTSSPVANSKTTMFAAVSFMSALVYPAPLTAAAVWEQLLSSQLLNEKKCTLAATLFVRELPVAEGILLSGRARCVDGREFDFSQNKPHLRFELRACEPVEC